MLAKSEAKVHASKIEKESGVGNLKEVTLGPIRKAVEESMIDNAIEQYHKAHEICYKANSINLEVKCNPVCKVKQV